MYLHQQAEFELGVCKLTVGLAINKGLGAPSNKSVISDRFVMLSEF
jgi:hypothetical protein